MKKLMISLITWACFTIFLGNGYAQTVQDSTVYNIETVDGNEFLGTIINQDSTSIQFQTEKHFHNNGSYVVI